MATPRSENDFMDVDVEREPQSTHDEEPTDDDGGAANNNDRQVTIEGTAADRPATPPPDQAAFPSPPDYMEDEEPADDTRIAF